MRSCGLRVSGEGLLLRRQRWLRRSLPPGSTALPDYLVRGELTLLASRAGAASGREFVPWRVGKIEVAV
jgi:hypothetical protein